MSENSGIEWTEGAPIIAKAIDFQLEKLRGDAA